MWVASGVFLISAGVIIYILAPAATAIMGRVGTAVTAATTAIVGGAETAGTAATIAIVGGAGTVGAAATTAIVGGAGTSGAGAAARAVPTTDLAITGRAARWCRSSYWSSCRDVSTSSTWNSNSNSYSDYGYCSRQLQCFQVQNQPVLLQKP